MIPVTFPSSLSSGNVRQMVVYVISPTATQMRWVDYIPIKFATPDLTQENTYNINGYIAVDVIENVSGKQEWKDYIPVVIDSTATDAYTVSLSGYIPTAYAGGAVQSFNFADGLNALSSKITFSRSSNGTIVNSNGQIAYAPHNLLTNSDNFNASAWSKGAPISITSNADTSPDGTITADKFVSTGGSYPTMYQSVSTISGVSYVGSIWVKSDGTSQIQQTLYFGTGSKTFTPTSTWTRITVNFTATTTTHNFTIATDSGTAPASSFYIWGAQLEIGSTATTYNPTTPKNLLGYTEEFDNAAWTKSNSFVQTNLLTYSEAFDDASWTKTRATVTANSIVAPNGTQTADKIVEDTNLNSRGMSRNLSTTPVSSPVTFSVYLKAGERQYVQIQLTDNAANVNGTLNMYYVAIDLATGVVGTPYSSGSPTSPSYTVTNAGNGWWRVSVSLTKKADAARTDVGINFVTSNNAVGTLPTTQGDGTSGFYSWGAQLVQGANPGDYARTDSTTMPVRYTAPNGFANAEKLVENTALANNHQINVSAITVSSGGKYTLSTYVKAAGRNYIVLYDSSVTKGKFFDLTNGTLGGNFVGAPDDASIVSLGNGWYRCSITYTQSTTSANPRIYLANTISSATYDGDGTSGIYIYGAQLSNSASLDPYVYNPAAALTSVAYYAPRFTYDPVTQQPLGLLIEEARTNILLNSVMAGGAAAPTSFTQPVATGTSAPVTSTKSNIGVAYSQSATAQRPFLSQSVSLAATTTYTVSMVIEATSGLANNVILGTADFAITQYYANGVAVSGSTASVTGTLTAVFTNNLGAGSYSIRFGIGIVTAATGTLTFSCPQLEAGAFATSYIPTGASSVTRAADVAVVQGNNFANWWNANEGTFYSQANGSGAILQACLSNNINSYAIRFQFFNPVMAIYDASTLTVSLGNITANILSKIAGAYKINDAALSIAGGAVATDTSTDVPYANNMYIGSRAGNSIFLNGTIKQISYFNKRLQNSQLQALTA